ncbi:MAG: hypothetical protein FWB86_09100 [Treponema sp.]|nr:hypothetical protein [Treponema sp.]MCL2272751.1 hypothetical protein [Treponema sp.]
MTFFPIIFERLFFPINKEVYKHIQKILDITGENQKNFNITIRYNQPDLNIEKLQFSMDFDISLDYINEPSAFPNANLLGLSFNQGDTVNSFYVPLKYLLDNRNEEILKNESHYIYSYALHIDKSAKINLVNNTVKVSEDIHQYLYIGITKNSWQKRYSSHCQNMKKNPQRLLSQALNGDFGKIIEKKLVIETAGLTEEEALDIEEREVNARSYKYLFEYGLNMIPGGYAGREMFSNKKAS